MTIVALIAPILALVIIGFVLRKESSRFASAATIVVEPGLDFSISSTSGGQNCDSSGTPTTTCAFPVNSTFTLNFNLHTIPPSLQTAGWGGYDMLLSEQGVTIVEASRTQKGADVWPDCTFDAYDFTNPHLLKAGCTVGIGAAGVFYTGLLMHVDFQCGSADTVGSLTLIPQDTSPTGGGDTGLLSNLLTEVYEEANPESLTIICGTPPTATPTATRTPGGPTDTPSPSPTITQTPASTPTPRETPTPANTPTRTPRPNHVLLGDVDGDLTVNSLDALWVLWFSAGIVVDVPLPDAADLNGDNVVNAMDALYILWVEAGEVTIL